MKIKAFCLVVLSLSNVAYGTPTSQQHSFAIYGHPKYKADFTHFDYVNPHPPKGGDIKGASFGTFDTFNPFSVRGNAEQNVGLTIATLMIQSQDEIGACYPFVAKSLKIDPEARQITFYINPLAKFDNGDPITAEDVVFSFEILRTEGQPFYRQYGKDIEKVEAVGTNEVRFYHGPKVNRELPLILGQTPILSKKFYRNHSFSEPSFVIPPSSGPYRIEKFDPGRSATYVRVTNWWASDLPSCRGFYNFDRLHFDYYRDNNTLFEAFKGGKADWRYETVARLWATSYHFPAAEAGAVVKQTLPDRKVITYGLAFNTSKAIFKDIKIRKALTLMYNFPWANKNLFFGEYERSKSYFEGAKKLMALGLPKGEELNVLLPYKNQLPQEVFSQEFSLPSEESPDFWHGIIKQAEVLFNQAGWVIKDFKMVNKVTEEHFNFEFLSPDKSIERIMGNYVESLKRLGINLRITTVDAANYEQRTQSGHYDMVLLGYAQSHTPGNEQRSFWHSATADLPGTRNIAKVKNPVVDNIVEQLIRADNYPSLCAHTRALDRVLLWNYYMIPAWASKTVRIAYWNRFGRPEKIAKYLPFQPHTWWIDKTKEAKIKTYLDENTRKGIFPAIREFFVKNAMKLFSSTAQQPHKNS